MDAPDPLFTEITTLLDAPVDRDDPDRLERTLTDGYARALSIEAEKWRLQRQMGEISSIGDRDRSKDLVALAKRLELQDDGLIRLRSLLVRLRERYSLALRSASRV
jgi:hypothetical protein